MAVLGVQLVVTLLTATLMHRLAPHCSFARWLLCNGSLFRYKHPSEEELRALAGKPRPRGRKERWANGLSEEKPLSVPRDAPFQLETCPLTTVDALGLASMTQNLEPLLKKQDWDWVLPVAKLAIRVGLAVVGSVLGAFLTFPGLRLAQTHRDALTMSEDRPMLQFLLHTSFLSPLFILWLWTKPIARDFLHQPPFGERPFSLLSDSAFDSGRLWLLVVLCLLRLAVTRPHLQAYLCLAKARVEQLRREAGRIEAREIQRRVVRVYCYVTVVSLQYLTPLILTLNCTLLLKTLGGYSWGLGPAPLLSPNPSSASAASIGFGEDEVQQTAARIAGALGGLLTPLFLRGILAYLIWWTAACQLLCSLFGLYFHQHLAGS
ncbi:transmembrane protein 161A isoform X6 [Macaca nemestrina]|uniref:Transmembrane protein 161A n=2 Tax=Cercopithecinae TaxID=9528 RepID=A0A2K6A4E2_MANLE|nr:transmembrane protein 161A isoform X11 [Macaca fascicularis]XP_011742697.1 transmembrane protein 161A isoform X7 [Macaca nemestrina]XP_011846097.1 PREDICTED: transmembrane protein 161A isoform X2 [Mandrillus leucophaeus]XP_050625608.1 transmembrane protein 161A isoform X4 [Macaca thibetana thibetana]